MLMALWWNDESADDDDVSLQSSGGALRQAPTASPSPLISRSAFDTHIYPPFWRKKNKQELLHLSKCVYVFPNIESPCGEGLTKGKPVQILMDCKSVTKKEESLGSGRN